MSNKITGVELIYRERLRQIEKEGWDVVHDANHQGGELSIAAACYAVDGTDAIVDIDGSDAWPWSPDHDKRKKHSPLKKMVIAGALIAAEIDRMLNQKAEIFINDNIDSIMSNEPNSND